MTTKARRLLPLLALCLACVAAAAPRGELLDNPETRAFVDEMVARHGFDAVALANLLGGVEVRDDILEAIARPAEAKPWHEYRPIFLTKARIDAGVVFWSRHQDLLERARQRYGVPPEIIVAILGVETRYGHHTGGYRVIDALATLAFEYPPRSDFFRRELEQFLLLTREEPVAPEQARGSYAGAMGQAQFIPSSYRRYAVDFDEDGRRDLWESTADAIGSVANYLHLHGWEPGRPVAAPTTVHGERYGLLLDQGLKPHTRLARLLQYGVEVPESWPGDHLAVLLELEAHDGPEYWLGLNNFYVITRYNHSALYAMAVYQLAREITAARAAEG